METKEIWKQLREMQDLAEKCIRMKRIRSEQKLNEREALIEKVKKLSHRIRFYVPEGLWNEYGKYSQSGGYFYWDCPDVPRRYQPLVIIDRILVEVAPDLLWRLQQVDFGEETANLAYRLRNPTNMIP